MSERVTQLTVCAFCGVEVSEGKGGWVDADWSTRCSETLPGEHEPVTLYAVPSVDELAEAMYQRASSGRQGDDRRFRNSIKGWAKLAHQVLTGGQR